MKRKVAAAAAAVLAVSMSIPAFAHQVNVVIPSEKPAAEETVTEEPAAEETTTEEPAAEETATEEPAAEEAVTEEPAAEETTTEEPAAEEEIDYDFKDVSAEDEELVKAAVEAGIVTGVTRTKLGADEKISVQDLCLILWNINGRPATPGKSAYNAFSADQYAVSAVKWGASQALISEADVPSRTLSVTELKAILAEAGYDVAAVADSDSDATKIDVIKLVVSLDTGAEETVKKGDHEVIVK